MQFFLDSSLSFQRILVCCFTFVFHGELLEHCGRALPNLHRAPGNCTTRTQIYFAPYDLLQEDFLSVDIQT